MEREVQQFRYNLTKPLVVYRPKKKGQQLDEPLPPFMEFM